MSTQNGHGEDLPFEALEEFEYESPFDGSGGGSSALLPEGLFLFEITRWELQPGNEFGKLPQMILGLEVVEVLDKSHSIYIEQGFIEWISLSKNAQFRMDALLSAVYGRAIRTTKVPNAASLIGKRIVAEVYQDEFDGKKRTRVRGGRFLPTRQWSNGIGGAKRTVVAATGAKAPPKQQQSAKPTGSGTEPVDL